VAVPSSFYGSSSGGGFYSGGSSGGSGLLSDSGPAGVDPSELTPHKMLQGVVKLLNSPDPDDQRQGMKYLESNDQLFSDADLAQYGIARPQHDSRSLFQKAVGGALSGIQVAGHYLGRPQQAVASGLQTSGMSIGGLLGVGINRATGGALEKQYDDVSLGDVASTHLRHMGEGFQRVTDVSGKHDINMRQAMGGSGSEGGRLGGLFDTIGVIATDPLSYVGTHGATEATKAGLAAFEKAGVEMSGKAGMAEAIQRGYKPTVEEITKAREIAADAAKEAGAGQRKAIGKFLFRGAEKTGGPFTQFKEGALLGAAGQDARTGLSRFAPTGLKDAETGARLAGAPRVAEKNVLMALSRGEKGLKFGNETLIARDILRGPLARRGLVATQALVDNPAVARVGETLDSLRNKIDHHDEQLAKMADARGATTATEAKMLDVQTARAKLVEEYNRVLGTIGTVADEASPAKPPIKGLSFDPPEDLGLGTNEVTARVNGEKAGAAMYSIDENGKVQIEAAQTLAEHKRKGIMDQLLGEIERQTGQPRHTFGPGERVMPGAEDWWKTVTGQDVDRATGQPIGEAIAPADRATPRFEPRQIVNPKYEAAGQQAVKHEHALHGLDQAAEELRIQAAAHDQRAAELADHIENLKAQREKLIEVQADVHGQATSEHWQQLSNQIEDLQGQLDDMHLNDNFDEQMNALSDTARTHEEGLAAARAEPTHVFQDVGDKNPEYTARVKQARDLERQMAKMDVQIERSQSKLATMTERQGARASERLDKLTARRADLAAKAEKLTEFKGTLPEQALANVPSKYRALRVLRERTRGAFVSDPGLKDIAGTTGREAFHGAEAMAEGRSLSKSSADVRAIANTFKDSKKESADFVDELANRIYPALETKGGAAALIDAYKAEDRGKAATFVQVLDNIRKRVTQERLDAGLLTPETMHDPDTYIQRLLTPEAARAFRDYKAGLTAGEPARASSGLFSDLAGEGSGEARKVGADLPVGEQLQSMHRAQMQEIAPGFQGDVIRTNPAEAVASSAVQSARQVAAKQFIEDVGQINDTSGRPLLTKDPDIGRALGYRETRSPSGDKIFAPQEVHKALGRFQDVMVNDETLKALQRTVQKANRIWKAQATVPLVGMAFHSRNAETNVMLNWIAGLENPVWYARAGRLQIKIARTMKELGTDSASWEDLLDKGRFSAEERKIVQGALDRGVLQNDYVGHGMESADTVGSKLEAKNVGPLRKIARKGKFWNTDQALGVRSGRATGRFIENNARLGHYMWALDEYGNAEVAANSVHKYLFDYNDLTPFERKIKDSYIPFYTFMRKNTALMARTLFENPGKLRRFTMAEQASRDENAPWLANKLIPAYQILGQTGNQAPRRGDPSGLITSIESPLSSATDTVMPFLQAAKETPGLQHVVPDAVRNPEGGAGVARDFLNLPGGPVAQAFRVAAGHAFDVDTFTGGPARRKGSMDKLLEFTDIFAVSPSKFARTVDKLGLNGASPKDFSPTELAMRRKAAVINLFLGLNASEVGTASSKQESRSRYYQQIRDYIDQHNRGLPDGDPRRIPTLEELQLAGKVPKDPSSSGLLGG
jgi:hypothetical protein